MPLFHHKVFFPYAQECSRADDIRNKKIYETGLVGMPVFVLRVLMHMAVFVRMGRIEPILVRFVLLHKVAQCKQVGGDDIKDNETDDKLSFQCNRSFV